MTFDDYIKKVEAGKISIETHGHISYTFEPREMQSALMFMRLTHTAYAAEMDSQIDFPLFKEGNCLGKCAICGKEPCITFYEDHIEIEDNHVDVGPFFVDIEFPTGVMIFDDNLREGYRERDFDINTTIGIKQCSESYAGQGMMHFYVGNSCPSVWREGDTIYVGCLSDADEHMAVGGIVTDLWWVSFVDQQRLASHLAKAAAGGEDIKVEERGEQARKRGSVKVTPGVYRCTSYYHVGRLDYGEERTQIFCKLEPK